MKYKLIIITFIINTILFADMTSGFFAAVHSADMKTVQEYITLGINIDIQDDKRRTALMIAMYKNDFKMAKLLIDNNANVNIQDNKLVAICTTSKKKEKDMPLKDCKELIQTLKSKGYTLLLLGAGNVAKEYGEELSKIAKDDFINLVDKTTIAQLGALLANCKALISVDTGTMHLGLAVDVPTVCLFYIHTKAHLDAWAPEKSLYRCEVLTENIKVENIVNSLRKIME